MKSLRPEQVRQMLSLQDRMNITVNPDWLNADYPFLRAVVVEVGEALDHLGWKWWKKESPDVAQASVELIDILHFMLSHELVQAQGDIDRAVINLVGSSNPGRKSIEFDNTSFTLDRNDPRKLLELLAGLAACRRNELSVLEACFDSLGMSWDQVHIQYVSKNVLNIFRQDNGYKSGTYVKVWAGLEDNVHLLELVTELDVRSATFSTELYGALTTRYFKTMNLSKG